MARQPTNVTFSIESLSFDTPHLQDVWLRFAQVLGGQAFLLAFADDGVIWGRVKNAQLRTSHGLFPEVSPSLRKETLQELHLFNSNGEVRIWRTSQGLRVVHIQDEPSEQTDALDERYLLWGTRYERAQNGFTLVSEGSRGFRHAVPLILDEDLFGQQNSMNHPLALHVRHYLQYDHTGSAYITLSRLVNLQGG